MSYHPYPEEGTPAGPCPNCGHMRIYSYGYKRRRPDIICLECEPGGVTARVNPNIVRQYERPDGGST